MAIDYDGLPETRDLLEAQEVHRQLLDAYSSLIAALEMVQRSPPADLVGKIICVTDRMGVFHRVNSIHDTKTLAQLIWDGKWHGRFSDDYREAQAYLRENK